MESMLKEWNFTAHFHKGMAFDELERILSITKRHTQNQNQSLKLLQS